MSIEVSNLKSGLRIGLLTTAAAFALGAQDAKAQSAAPALEEIIVTAQKLEQRLQDVPTSVDVVTADALRAASVTEVNQLSNLTPGIMINSDQTGRNTAIKIRGVGNDEGSNLRPSIGFFYNEVPLMTQKQGGQSVASDLDLGDLERVEIIKGPQSTLFGESVSGGAIDFVTKRPSIGEGFNGRISLTAGDHKLRQGRGAVGAAFGDKAAARLSFFTSTMDDQVLNTATNSRRELTSEGYAFQFLFEPTDNLRFVVEHNRRRTETQGGFNDGEEVLAYGPQTIADAAAAGITLTPADPYDRKAQMVFPLEEVMINKLTSLHAYWDINENWSATSITGYQTNKDVFGSEGGLLGGYNVGGTNVVGFWAIGDQHIKYTTQEVRLNYAGDKLNSTFGAFYSNYKAPVSKIDIGFVFPGTIFPALTYQTDDNDQWSVFTHNSYKFNKDWELVFGARYTDESGEGYRELAYGQGAYSGLPLDTSTFNLLKSDVNAWGGTLKLLRNLNDSVSVYAGIDRGFRLGGVNTLGASNYDTEIAYNYEAGIKGLFFGKTLRLEASVYNTDYNGYQAVLYDSASFTFTTQNADVTVRGVEVSADWAPISALLIDGSIAYNDAKYDNYFGASCDNYQNANGLCPNNPVPGAQDLSGERLPQSPKWSGNLNVEYGLPIASTGMEWFVRGEMVYRDSAFAHAVGVNGDPLQKMPSYTLFNASLGLVNPDQGWRARAWVKNLTDEDYLTQVIRQPAGSDPNYVVGRVGMERSAGLTLSYDF